MSNVAAIITAAGSSTRMGGIKKEYRLLKGAGVAASNEASEKLTVLGACAGTFAACGEITTIVITVPADAETGEWAARMAIAPLLEAENTCLKRRIFFVPGGHSRRISVHHALSFLQMENPDYVLIHDGARPWVSSSLIKQVLNAAFLSGAAIPVLPLVETPKELDGKGFVARHFKRASLAAAQTPQGFKFNEILAAHEKAAEVELRDNTEWTDDAEIWGAFVGPVAVVPGDTLNKKITFLEDL